jgi:hypothetical protein
MRRWSYMNIQLEKTVFKYEGYLFFSSYLENLIYNEPFAVSHVIKKMCDAYKL